MICPYLFHSILILAIICPVERGYVFDECGSPCKRTCANRNLPPDDIAAQCYLPCVSGCQCPAGMVEHERRCILSQHCPKNLFSTADESVGYNLHQLRAGPVGRESYHPMANRHSKLVKPPLVIPSQPIQHG